MKKIDVFIILVLVVAAFFFFTYKRADRVKETTNNVSVEEQLQLPAQEVTSTPNKRQRKANEVYYNRQNSITRAVSKVEPAVVSVNIIKTEIHRRYANRSQNPFFNFFDIVPYEKQIPGLGSGVIFSEDGYIISNAHVVEGATEITIILTDGRQFDGKVIGIDNVHDIAILKIDGKNLPTAKLGISSDLIIGEWAIAVGNPYGFLIKDSKPSVAVGVVSAVNRDFAENKDGKVYRRMIQTDAAINPGNSGGPLVNIYGEIIGINTFIFSESGGSIGLGFSIPIDRVRKITEELIKYGKMRDIWFGFKVQDINRMMASYLNLKSLDGVIVTTVDPKSPVGSAGLKKGDVIFEINSIKIKNVSDAELAVSDVAVGDTMIIKISRNGKNIELTVDAIEYK
jgi:serine protease Do